MSKVQGPLGIWSWPMLNAILNIMLEDGEEEGDVVMKEINVNRDEDGKIDSVEIISASNEQ